MAYRKQEEEGSLAEQNTLLPKVEMESPLIAHIFSRISDPRVMLRARFKCKIWSVNPTSVSVLLAYWVNVNTPN
jgi:hypothetical protein